MGQNINTSISQTWCKGLSPQDVYLLHCRRVHTVPVLLRGWGLSGMGLITRLHRKRLTYFNSWQFSHQSPIISVTLKYPFFSLFTKWMGTQGAADDRGKAPRAWLSSLRFWHGLVPSIRARLSRGGFHPCPPPQMDSLVGILKQSSWTALAQLGFYSIWDLWLKKWSLETLERWWLDLIYTDRKGDLLGKKNEREGLGSDFCAALELQLAAEGSAKATQNSLASEPYLLPTTLQERIFITHFPTIFISHSPSEVRARWRP